MDTKKLEALDKWERVAIIAAVAWAVVASVIVRMHL
jgi:hypothetical protein